MHGGNWSYLNYGESVACDLGVWRVRVVSTKLEYMMSLGQVLPWGATWAPLEWIPVVGKMVYEVVLGMNL